MNHAIQVAGALLVLVGCGQPFSNDDILFLKSLPNRDLIRVAVPESMNANGLRGAQAACGVEPADLYLDTRGTAQGINQGILGALGIVDFVTMLPPTSREDDVRTWGPFEDKGNELRLTIQRVRTTTVVTSVADGSQIKLETFFTYRLEGRRMDQSAFVAPFSGTFSEVGTARRGIGTLKIDLDAIAIIDPDEKGRGQFLVRYDTRGEGVALAIDLRNFGEAGMRVDAARYEFMESATGRGAFLFRLPVDVDENNPRRPAVENLRIRARWLPDNRGRADAVISDGDYPTPVFASQCWGVDFIQTFAEWSSGDFTGMCGSEGNCAPEFGTASFPGM